MKISTWRMGLSCMDEVVEEHNPLIGSEGMTFTKGGVSREIILSVRYSSLHGLEKGKSG
jgi:hypothetical protein